MKSGGALFDEIIRQKIRLKNLELQHFLTQEVFGWVWWLGIACVIVTAAIWWKTVDRRQLTELCLFGLIVSVLAVFLDVAGSEMVLWNYSISIFLPLPILFPVDFVILPAVNTIVYQKCPGWGRYMVICAITAALLSFGFEPFAIWIGQYKLITWRLLYSFPIYVTINVFTKFVVNGLKGKQITSAALFLERKPE